MDIFPSKEIGLSKPKESKLKHQLIKMIKKKKYWKKTLNDGEDLLAYIYERQKKRVKQNTDLKIANRELEAKVIELETVNNQLKNELKIAKGNASHWEKVAEGYLQELHCVDHVEESYIVNPEENEQQKVQDKTTVEQQQKMQYSAAAEKTNFPITETMLDSIEQKCLKRFVGKLMSKLYTREYLITHKMTDRSRCRGGTSKRVMMNPRELSSIINAVLSRKHTFTVDPKHPVTESTIRAAIGAKFANCRNFNESTVIKL